MDAWIKTSMGKRMAVGIVVLLAVVLLVTLRNLGGLSFGEERDLKEQGFIPEGLKVGSVARTLEESRKRFIPIDQDKIRNSAAVPKTGAVSWTSEVQYSAHELRDPFQNLLPQDASLTQPRRRSEAQGRDEERQAVVAAPPLIVQGMMWGGREPNAIINNEIYRVGDDD